MKFKEFLKSDKFKYILVIVFAIIAFIVIYGIRIINPCYTDWLLYGAGDNSQHYLGWKAYRESAWHFPLGMMDNLMYPYRNSIIFTDSIPLFAVIFKLISWILPAEFQYFGLWGVMCFALQGVLTAKIVKKYTNNTFIVVLAALLSVLTPVVFMRMYRHTALGGQWLLLLGLDILFEREKYREKKQWLYIMVGILAFLCSSIHLYFAMMNGIILLGICALEILESKKVLRSILLLVEYVTIIGVVTALLGGFSSGMEAQNGGLGYYSSNINTLINPQGWSSILKDLPVIDEKQWEGSGYLGFGFIFLLIVGIPLCISFKKTKELLRKHWKLLAVLAGVFVIAFVFALSQKVTFGSHVLYEINLPKAIYKLWAIFRASGRAVWICVYIIEICIFISLIKFSDKRFVLSVLIIALFFQGYDLHDALAVKHQRFANKVVHNSALKDTEFWEKIGQNENIKHVVYFSTVDLVYMYSMTDWALDYNMTVNRFPFAREVEDTIKDYRQSVLENPQDDIVYIFKSNEGIYCKNYDLNYYFADGLIVGLKQPLEGVNKIVFTESDAEPSLEWIFADNQCISENGGQDTEAGRELYPGGFSFGPYWSVEKGNYQIKVTGDYIPYELEVSVYTAGGQNKCKYVLSERTQQEITVILELDEDVSDLEIKLNNLSGESAVLKSVSITNL